MAKLTIKSIFSWLLAMILASALLLSAPTHSAAQEGDFGSTGSGSDSAAADVDADIDKYFDTGSGKTASDFRSDTGLGGGELSTIIADIIKIALGFLGVVAVIVILVGGFKWMTAGGSDDKIKSARKLLFSGIIGLVIVLAAYAIAAFVIEAIAGAVS